MITTAKNAVYFLTGANRGIGLELAKLIASDSTSTLIATARDPSNATELNELASQTGNVSIIPLDVSSMDSIEALDLVLPTVASKGIDYFISNAAIATAGAYKPIVEVEKQVWIDHYVTNTLGPTLLAGKLLPYMKMRDTKVMHFVSSSVGSISGFLPVSVSAYGQSKAALNYVVNALANELGPQGFTVLAVDPGLNKTSMGQNGVVFHSEKNPKLGESMKARMIEPSESAAGQLAILHNVVKKQNGSFFRYDGSPTPW